MREHAITLGAGSAGGLLGLLLGVPAGALLGALLGTATVVLVRDRGAQPPSWLAPAARTMVGIVVGSTVTWEVLRTLGRSLPWAIAATAVVTVAGWVCGQLLFRWSSLDRATAMVSCAPGGLAEMTALAQQVGARGETVAAIHLARKLLCLGIVLLVVTVAT